MYSRGVYDFAIKKIDEKGNIGFVYKELTKKGN